MKFRDTSKIVSLYTRRFGRVSVVAKGARDRKSRFGAALEPMSHVSAVFYKKERSDLHLLSQCDLLNGFRRIADWLRHRIPMARIEKGCSALLRTQFRFIVTEGGGTAVDIDNEPDLEDLPAEVRERIEVFPVDTLGEALAITLRDTTLRDGRLHFGEHVAGDEGRLAH